MSEPAGFDTTRHELPAHPNCMMKLLKRWHSLQDEDDHAVGRTGPHTSTAGNQGGAHLSDDSQGGASPSSSSSSSSSDADSDSHDGLRTGTGASAPDRVNVLPFIGFSPCHFMLQAGNEMCANSSASDGMQSLCTLALGPSERGKF